MGKEGITVVTKALRADDISEDDAPEAAEFLLEGFSFLYENPKSNVSFFKYLFNNLLIRCYVYQQDKGGFRGSLVASAFGAHIKKTIGYDSETSGVGFPIGGLAVAAAVVCNFLNIYSLDHA
jgi:hypothetical protein